MLFIGLWLILVALLARFLYPRKMLMAAGAVLFGIGALFADSIPMPFGMALAVGMFGYALGAALIVALVAHGSSALAMRLGVRSLWINLPLCGAVIIWLSYSF